MKEESRGPEAPASHGKISDGNRSSFIRWATEGKGLMTLSEPEQCVRLAKVAFLLTRTSFC